MNPAGCEADFFFTALSFCTLCQDGKRGQPSGRYCKFFCHTSCFACVFSCIIIPLELVIGGSREGCWIQYGVSLQAHKRYAERLKGFEKWALWATFVCSWNLQAGKVSCLWNPSICDLIYPCCQGYLFCFRLKTMLGSWLNCIVCWINCSVWSVFLTGCLWEQNDLPSSQAEGGIISFQGNKMQGHATSNGKKNHFNPLLPRNMDCKDHLHNWENIQIKTPWCREELQILIKVRGMDWFFSPKAGDNRSVG